MTDSTAVEKAAPSQVPALVNTPALEIGAEDVALPRVYLGQFMSDHVQDGRVPAGSVFTALGSDDPEPNVLCEQGEPGVRFHVLAMRKGKSVSEDGELTLYSYDDPAAPPDAWVTYNYVVALPAVDQDVPFKWLLTRTATQAAKQINFVLSKNAAKGPAYVNAFEVTAAPRENKKGKFFVPSISVVEANKDDVKIAEALTVMVSGDSADVHAENDEPDI